MASLRLLGLAVAAALVAACTASSDRAVTDDSAEIVEGRSFLERDLDPPIAPPAPGVIGRKTTDALAEATKGAKSAGVTKLRDGCSIERFAGANAAIIAEHELCSRSETIRELDANGAATTTYDDLNRDGKIDRFSGEDGAFILYVDANFDAKVDETVERVDRIEGFTTNGYPESYPASKFIHRIRDDRDKDGKLDHEEILAKGLLPPSQ